MYVMWMDITCITDIGRLSLSTFYSKDYQWSDSISIEVADEELDDHAGEGQEETRLLCHALLYL